LSVSFSPDGKQVASGSRDNTVRIWETSTVTCQSKLRGDKQINCVAFSPDGKILAADDGKMFEAGSVRLYDTVTGDVKSTLNGHTRSVTKLEYVDAKTFVSQDGTVRVSQDGTVRVWNINTGAPKGEFEGGSFGFSKDSSSEQKVGQYSMTFKQNLLFISEGQSVVAFFRAPHAISCVASAGERISVGCENGEVL
jgi:WD40 repeat protein